MIRSLRWLLLLAFLGGLLFVAYRVPLGGQTLWERVAPGAVPAPTAEPVQEPATGSAGAPARVKLAPPGGEPAPVSDMHTEPERQALDRLIEDKLKGGREAGPPAGR
jgi:hypothetical protein